MKHLFYTFLSGLLFISNILPSNAQDYPPNPLEKEGYRLIFHDEFDGKEINTDKWIPEYLPSWPKDRSVCTPTYEMKNGIIRLIIDKNSKNEFDNGMYISGFMSASRTGLHHYDPKKKALHQIKTEATQINQYGYYEMRAKMQIAGKILPFNIIRNIRGLPIKNWQKNSIYMASTGHRKVSLFMSMAYRL